MIQVSRERKDTEAQDFWQYVLQILQKLKHGGMSDEEDATQVVTRGEVTGTEPIKRVLDLEFRNPYFRGLFEAVDKTKASENMVFNRGGKQAMKRIRVDTVSVRQPPKGLPRNFLSDKFLQTLLPHEEAALRLKKDFVFRHFENVGSYDY